MKIKPALFLAMLWSVFVHSTATNAAIIIYHPNSEDRLTNSTAFRVEWRANGVGDFTDWTFSLMTNGVRFRSGPAFSPVYEGDGWWHANFAVPANVPSNCNATLVVADDGSEEKRTSQPFCLVSPSVKVRRPNASDRWQPGSIIRAEWCAKGIESPDFSFELWINNEHFCTLFPETVDDGDGNWHADIVAPESVPSNCNSTLIVSEDTGIEPYDRSEAFCMGVPVAKIQVSQVEICWNSRSNKTYQVQSRSLLTTNMWANIGLAVPGNGSTNCVTDVVTPGAPQKYYRVEELP